jgi:hypothetical protein
LVLEPRLVSEVGLLEVLQTSIFDSGLSGLRWSDFDQLESSGRFLTWVQTTKLTNLAINTFSLPT